MSETDPPPPLRVLPYGTAGDFDGSRFLRAGRRFGAAALALTVVFLMASDGGSRVYRAFIDSQSHEVRQTIPQFTLLLQTLFVGAGLALTVAGRPRSPGLRSGTGWGYGASLFVNLLAGLAAFLEVTHSVLYVHWDCLPGCSF